MVDVRVVQASKTCPHCTRMQINVANEAWREFHSVDAGNSSDEISGFRLTTLWEYVNWTGTVPCRMLRGEPHEFTLAS